MLSAKRLGYTDILCLCFSQSNYLDEKIAKKIASENGFDFIFHALDNGNYLKNIDETVFVNDGLTLYAGATQMLFSLNLLDWTRTGLLHTGLLWFSRFNEFMPPTPMDRDAVKELSYSTKLLDDRIFQELHIFEKYENFEQLAIYERGFNGQFNGYRMIEQFTEFSSPLHDKDFLEYSLRIPPHQRNTDLYLHWILSKIPDAAGYTWQKTGVSVGAGPGKRFLYGIFRLLMRKLQGKKFRDSMNPTEYWYATNPSLRETFESYYTLHIGLLRHHPSLMNDAQRLFSEGTCLEKTQVLTLLGAMKLYSI